MINYRYEDFEQIAIGAMCFMNYLTRMGCVVLAVIASLVTNAVDAQDFLKDAKRVVFLGDSITYSGEYIAILEAGVRLEFPDRKFEFLDLGLPSETISGLSEPGHAGGNFPRPNLHERLDRVLQQTTPDLVVACYGMNCGIYHPYSDERFDAYCQGIRKLHEKVIAANSRLVLITPPVFDPIPILDHTLAAGQTEYRQPFRDYNQVLDLFAAWLVAAQTEGWQAIDTHTPMNRFLAQQRRTDVKFTLAPDGVHLNSQGHWLIARELMRTLGKTRINADAETIEEGFAAIGAVAPLFERIQSRQRLLTDAWLSAIGHKRPGMNQGLPIDQAVEQAQKLELEIMQYRK